MMTLPSDDLQRRQRAKNLAVAAIVAGLCVLFFVVTLLRMGVRP